MRIEKTERRARMWEHLKEAIGKGHTSKALDQAVWYYLRMHGSNHAYLSGVIDNVLDVAEAEGSLTAQQIADLLDSEELRIVYDVNRSVGEN